MDTSPRSLSLRTLFPSLLILLAINIVSVAQVNKITTKNKQNNKTDKAEQEKKKAPVDSARTNITDEKQLETLPLQGIRNIDDYSLLSPGVLPAPKANGVQLFGTSGLFSVNGMRARSNNINVDGADVNDEELGGRRFGLATPTSQNIESIKEVQITTSLWSADFGRNFGSQVSATTKSGTNQVHGTVYDFFSHSALNAKNYFDYTSDKWAERMLTAPSNYDFYLGVPASRIIPVKFYVVSVDGMTLVESNFSQKNPSAGKDPLKRNMGGGAIGFPIKKDKTFVFGSFERRDISSQRETHFAVPTIAQRGFLHKGAFGYAAVNAGKVYYLKPASFINGNIAFSYYPFGNNPDSPYGGNTYTQVLPANGQGTMFSGRMDHSFKFFGKTSTLAGRYNFSDDQQDLPAVGGAIYSNMNAKARNHNISVFMTSFINSGLVNQLRGSFGRLNLNFKQLRYGEQRATELDAKDGFLLSTVPYFNYTTPRLGIPNEVFYYTEPDYPTHNYTGAIGRINIAPFSPVGIDTSSIPSSRISDTVQIADTLSWSRTNKEYKFGFDIRKSHIESMLNRNSRPQITFGGVPDLTPLSIFPVLRNTTQNGPTPGYFNGSDMAALGLPTSMLQTLSLKEQDSNLDLKFWQFNLFANNNWKLRNGLTLDLGVRYELNIPPRDANGRFDSFFDGLPLTGSDPNLSIYSDPAGIAYPTSFLVDRYNSVVDAYKKVVGDRSSIYDMDTNNWGGHFGFAWDPFAGNSNQAGKTVIRAGAGIYYDTALAATVSQSRNFTPSEIPFNYDFNTFTFAQNSYFVPKDITGPFNFPTLSSIRVRLCDPKNLATCRYENLIKPGTVNTIGLPANVLPQLLGAMLYGSEITAGATGGLAFTLPDKSMTTPYTLQFNFQIERELAKDSTLNVAYAGSKGNQLTRLRTPNGGLNAINVPLNPWGLPVGIGNPALTLPLGGMNKDQINLRPNRYLGAYSIYDSSAASNYHSLQAALSQRFAESYQINAAYTWSKAMDDVSDLFDLAGAYNLPQDDSNLRGERGYANFDIRHRFVINAIGDLPFISRFNNSKGAKRLLFGNWQFSTISTFQTGQPFTVNSSYDVNLDGNLTDRLDKGSAVVIDDNGRNKLNLNTQAWKVLAATGSNGSVGRNTFRSDGLVNVDLALIKNFRIKEGHTLVFKTEAFNLLNRAHFGTPVRILEAPNFGQSVDTTLESRQIQFALKYVF